MEQVAKLSNPGYDNFEETLFTDQLRTFKINASFGAKGKMPQQCNWILVFFCENKPYITDAFSYAKQLGVQLQKIDDGPFKKAYDKYAPWLHNIRRTQYNNSEGGC